MGCPYVGESHERFRIEGRQRVLGTQKGLAIIYAIDWILPPLSNDWITCIVYSFIAFKMPLRYRVQSISN